MGFEHRFTNLEQDSQWLCARCILGPLDPFDKGIGIGVISRVGAVSWQRSIFTIKLTCTPLYSLDDVLRALWYTSVAVLRLLLPVSFLQLARIKVHLLFQRNKTIQLISLLNLDSSKTIGALRSCCCRRFCSIRFASWGSAVWSGRAGSFF